MGMTQIFVISIWAMAIKVETDVGDERGFLNCLQYLH